MQAHRPSKASMMISGLDKVESKRQLRAVRGEQIVEDRKEKQEKKIQKEQEELEERSRAGLEMLMAEQVSKEGGELGQEQGLSGARKLKRNTLPLPQTALAAIR